MTARYFIPRAEQLESKLLMAVVHAMTTAEEPTAASVPTSDAARVRMPVEYSSAMFSTRREGSDTVLVVHFDSTQPKRMLQIVGGESAMTRDDGTAQLRLPPATRSVDLTIDNEMGQQVPWTRLEFSADGEILRQTRLISDSQTQNSPASLVIATNHSNSHSAALIPLLFAGANDWTHAATGGQHDDAMIGSTVDQAMAHDYGMSTSNDSAKHEESDADFSHGKSTTPVQNPDYQENSGAVAVTEHGTPGAEQPVEVPVLPAQDAMAIKPAEEEFDFDSVAEGWTTGEPVERVSRVQVVLPTIDVATLELPPQPPEPAPVVFVSYVTTAEEPPPPSNPESSNWGFTRGMMLAATAGIGAYLVDRRAERFQGPDGAHGPSESDALHPFFPFVS